jgi:hypothetical protein
MADFLLRFCHNAIADQLDANDGEDGTGDDNNQQKAQDELSDDGYP